MARVIGPIVLALVLLGAVVAATVLTVGPAAATQSARSREALAKAPGQDDASSGQDAGDVPSSALLISAGEQKWNATLSPPGSDRDWYRTSASGAFCAEATAHSNAIGMVRLGSGEDLATSVWGETRPQSPARLALAARAGGAPFLGFLPSPTVSTSSFGDTTDTRPGPGRYDFSIDVAGHADLPGEAADAGSTLATASPLPQGCSAGTLDRALADGEDRYHFDITEAGEVTISFAIAAGSGAEVRILTPTGALYGTIQDGAALSVWASEIGRWQVVVGDPPPAPTDAAAPGLALGLPALRLEQTDYLLGVVGPGDPEPCRPSC